MTSESAQPSICGRHLILPLNRPQYTVPEAFSTCLAWSLFDVDLADAEDPDKEIALTYKAENRFPSRTLEYRRTYPVGDDERLDLFATSLRDHGLEAETDQRALAEAVANSIRGIETKKGKSQSAAPLTVGTALLQNFTGIVGSANAPNIGLIIEGLFGLGRPTVDEPSNAASLWQKAVEYRVEIDPILSAIDLSVRKTLLDNEPIPKPQTKRDRDSSIAWVGLLEQSPFSWFNRSWAALTRDEWVTALPPRVWVDWASTVMRMAVGMGFLWEASLNESIARLLLQREDAGTSDRNWLTIRASMPDLLPWRSRYSQATVRDVSSILSRRVKRSEQIRSSLSSWMNDKDAESLPLEKVLNEMSADEALVSELTATLGSTPQKKSNLWEAIRYSLMVRDESGPYADHYGILRSRGSRYLIPHPGTEWIAVVASLCCPGPSSQTDLGEVMRSLRELGLRPELSEVVNLLERAGLARGSADADQGVIVESAF